MLENKAVITGIFYAFGVPLSILQIWANFGTWKANIIYMLVIALWVIKAIYTVVEKEQSRKKRNMDLEKQRFELDKEKSKDE